MLQFIMHVTYLTWFMHALCMSSSTYKQQSKVSYQMLEKLFRTSHSWQACISSSVHANVPQLQHNVTSHQPTVKTLNVQQLQHVSFM